MYVASWAQSLLVLVRLLDEKGWAGGSSVARAPAIDTSTMPILNRHPVAGVWFRGWTRLV